MENKNFVNKDLADEPFVYKRYVASITYSRQNNALILSAIQ